MNREQQERVLDLVTDLPWYEFDNAICAIEDGLRLGLEATAEAFPMWEEMEGDRFVDEYSLTPDEVHKLSPDELLAYLARLLRDIALNYGVSTEFGKHPFVAEVDSDSPANILRGLYRISRLSLTSEHDGM